MTADLRVLSSFLREFARRTNLQRVEAPLTEEELSLRPQVPYRDATSVETRESYSGNRKVKDAPENLWNENIIIDPKKTYTPKVSLNFFLDGRQRTSFVGVIPVRTTGEVIPVHVGQIGAVILNRTNRQLSHIKRFAPTLFVILLPLQFILDICDNPQAKGYLRKLPQTGFEICDTSYDPNPERDEEGRAKLDSQGNEKHNRIETSELENKLNDLNYFRSLARRWLRRKRAVLEQRLHSDFAAEQGEAEKGTNIYEFLAKDGTITDVRREMFLRCAVGISKSFNTRFLSAAQHNQVLRLPEFHRSPVFRFRGYDESSLETGENPSKAIRMAPRLSWYIRIRDPSGHPPEWGLLRLELYPKLLPSEGSADRWGAEDTELVNGISRAVIEERTPSSYPDSRWHNLLYPIKKCEDYLSSIMTSHQVIRYILSPGR